MKKSLIIAAVVAFTLYSSPVQAIDIQPVNWHDIGLEYFQDSKYDLAIESFTKAIEQDPDDASHHLYHRGAAYAEKRQPHKALADLNRAQTDRPNSHWLYYYRYLAHIELQEYKKAEQDAEKMLQLDPQSVDGFHALGFIDMRKGNYGKALSNTNKALRIFANAGSYNNRGIIYIELEEYELALKSFEQALIVDPEYSVLYYNKATTLQQLGQNEEAIKYYRLYLEKSDNHDNYNTNNTETLTKDAQKSIANLEKRKTKKTGNADF